MSIWKKIKMKFFWIFKNFPATLGSLIGNLLAQLSGDIDGVVINGIILTAAVFFEIICFYHRRKFQKLLDDLNINITLAEAIIEAEKPDWRKE